MYTTDSFCLIKYLLFNVLFENSWPICRHHHWTAWKKHLPNYILNGIGKLCFWNINVQKGFICLFLRFFVPLKNFSFILRRPNYQWRNSNFDQCLAVMANKQRERDFFSGSCLHWKGTSIICKDLWHSPLLRSVWH